MIAIEAVLTRADRTSRSGAEGFRVGTLSSYEASPMELSEVGELVFRVQRLRSEARNWLRGALRAELLLHAQELLDSARLTAQQRAWIAQALLRRLESVNVFNVRQRRPKPGQRRALCS